MEINENKNQIDYDKILQEEDRINELLQNITLKKPKNIFHIFLQDKLNEEIEFKEYSDDSEISDELIKKKIPYYRELWRNVSIEEKEKYKALYNKEYKNYLKEIEIVKKYLFKGIDGNIKLRPTAYHIYLNDKLIEGLENGDDPNYINKNAKLEWKNMGIDQKRTYLRKKKENDTIIELVLKYKHMNPLILFVYHKLEKSKRKNLKIPTMNEILKCWDKLSSKAKTKYEIFSKDLYLKKYNLINIYYAIYGVKPKTPSGAIRMFLQFKAKLNEISSIKEGLELWNNLSKDEKDEYLKYSHNFYLAYKYQQLLYNHKINRIIPRKPSIFQLYLNDKKGLKIPKGSNTIKYWREKFNSLNLEERKKYEKKYNTLLNLYNKKINLFNNKIFDLPKPPQNSFTLYVSFKFRELYKINPNFEPEVVFDSIAKEWAEGKIDKKAYETESINEKERFKQQVIYFEKFGYYFKKIDSNLIYDEDEDEDDKSKDNIKITKKKSRDSSSLHNKKKKTINGKK